MQLQQAQQIAERVKAELEPHCDRIAIAGSIRRKKPEVKDIEIVAIPKPYDPSPLFATGIATVVNQWEKVKGELPCKYTQRILPEGIKLDLFFAIPENWGLIYAIRTGSAEYSHKVLASGWVRNGYQSVDGMLSIYQHHSDESPRKFCECREEEDLFRMAGVDWVEPEDRELSEG